MKKTAYGLLQLAALGLVVCGVAFWSFPAALIVLGIALFAIGELRS